MRGSLPAPADTVTLTVVVTLRAGVVGSCPEKVTFPVAAVPPLWKMKVTEPPAVVPWDEIPLEPEPMAATFPSPAPLTTPVIRVPSATGAPFAWGMRTVMFTALRVLSETFAVVVVRVT